MTSYPGWPAIAIPILPNISRSQENQEVLLVNRIYIPESIM